jgi:3-phenylpropionate/trans-cinnamate dioxygenase ferredoxin reductase subunit
VIGLEAAASAVRRGCEVTVVEIADRVMARSIPPDISAWMQAQHEARGVRFRCPGQVKGHGDDPARPVLQLVGGELIAADLVVIGAGIVPATGLARECGLECNDGITVNEFGETSVPGIYAAGDVAWYPDFWAGRHMRSENWFHAEKHAKCVARNMLGAREAYDEIQTMWSDQYDFKLQIAGALEGDGQVNRGDRDSGHFMVFYLRGGCVVGALGVNQSKSMRIVQNLIRDRSRVNPAVLADPDANLKQAVL